MYSKTNHKKSISSMVLTIIIFLSTLCISGCGNSRNTKAMNAEFTSLEACLRGIKRNSGETLKIIIDEPDEVLGKLSNGEGFGCVKKESGTKGIYYHGYFMVEIS